MPRRPSLSCRQFRRQHAEYMDGLVSGETVRACEAHLDACAPCARHDVQIRRSLLALQALPMIEPSAGFGERLAERIAREAIDGPPVHPSGIRWGMAGTILAASVALLVAASSRTYPTEPVRLVPVLARAPEGPPAVPPRETPVLTAVVTRPAARFEALPGQAPLRDAPLLLRAPTLRLQTVNYLGQ